MPPSFKVLLVLFSTLLLFCSSFFYIIFYFPACASETATTTTSTTTMVMPSYTRVLYFAGTARGGTIVLWAADALSEVGEANDHPPSCDEGGSIGADAKAAAAELPPWWSTTFTWNLTHPPPLHPAAVGGGAGLGRGTAATTLFIVVSGETALEASRRAERYRDEETGSGDEGGRVRRRTAGVKEEVVEGGGGEEDGSGVLWTVGVAPEVTFRWDWKYVCASKWFCVPLRLTPCTPLCMGCRVRIFTSRFGGPIQG